MDRYAVVTKIKFLCQKFVKPCLNGIVILHMIDSTC